MKSTKEKINYVLLADLYEKKDKDDPRDTTTRALENLHEQIELNNKRINNLVDRYHELFNSFSRYKRCAFSKEENKDK